MEMFITIENLRCVERKRDRNRTLVAELVHTSLAYIDMQPEIPEDTSFVVVLYPLWPTPLISNRGNTYRYWLGVKLALKVQFCDLVC